MQTALKCRNINLANEMYKICNPVAGTGGGRLWKTAETMAVWKGAVDSHTVDVGNVSHMEVDEYLNAEIDALVPIVTGDIDSPLETDWVTTYETTDTNPFGLWFEYSPIGGVPTLIGNLNDIGFIRTGTTSAGGPGIRVRLKIDGEIAVDWKVVNGAAILLNGAPGMASGHSGSTMHRYCSNQLFCESSYKVEVCRNGAIGNKRFRMFGTYDSECLVCKMSYNL